MNRRALLKSLLGVPIAAVAAKAAAKDAEPCWISDSFHLTKQAIEDYRPQIGDVITIDYGASYPFTATIDSSHEWPNEL